MSVKCPKCHHENSDDTFYCGKCATPHQISKDIGVTKTIETPVEELTLGSLFADRYEIIEELGKGDIMHVSIFNSRFKTLMMSLITLLLLLNFHCFRSPNSPDKEEDVIVGPEVLLTGVYSWEITEKSYGSCDPNSGPDVTLNWDNFNQRKRLELNTDFSYEEQTWNVDPSNNFLTFASEEIGFWFADEDTITFNYEGNYSRFSYTLSGNIFTKLRGDCENKYWERYTYHRGWLAR